MGSKETNATKSEQYGASFYIQDFFTIYLHRYSNYV